MIVEDVRVLEDWQTRSQLVYVLVRAYPGALRGVLAADGQTVQEMPENVMAGQSVEPTVRLPEGILERLVGLVDPPARSAVEAHRDDAVEVRDRLLDVVERVALRPTTYINGAEHIFQSEVPERSTTMGGKQQPTGGAT